MKENSHTVKFDGQEYAVDISYNGENRIKGRTYYNKGKLFVKIINLGEDPTGLKGYLLATGENRTPNKYNKPYLEIFNYVKQNLI